MWKEEDVDCMVWKQLHDPLWPQTSLHLLPLLAHSHFTLCIFSIKEVKRTKSNQTGLSQLRASSVALCFCLMIIIAVFLLFGLPFKRVTNIRLTVSAYYFSVVSLHLKKEGTRLEAQVHEICSCCSSCMCVYSGVCVFVYDSSLETCTDDDPRCGGIALGIFLTPEAPAVTCFTGSLVTSTVLTEGKRKQFFPKQTHSQFVCLYPLKLSHSNCLFLFLSNSHIRQKIGCC